MNQLEKIYLSIGLVLITAVFVYMALFFTGLNDLRFIYNERSDKAVKLINAAILLWPGGIFIAAAYSTRPNKGKISIKTIILGTVTALILLAPIALLDFVVN